MFILCFHKSYLGYVLNHTYIFLALSEIEVITYTFVYAAPTYETATTRKFRYGRTETLRQGFIEFES